MTKTLVELRREIERSIEAYLEASVIGQASTEDLRALVPMMIQERIAERVGCEPGEVELVNPRWNEAGTLFEADGVRVPSIGITIEFSAGER